MKVRELVDELIAYGVDNDLNGLRIEREDLSIVTLSSSITFKKPIIERFTISIVRETA